MTPDGWRIGVDIGGTFTDVALTPPAAAREYGAHDAEALGCPWCRAGDRAPFARARVSRRRTLPAGRGAGRHP